MEIYKALRAVIEPSDTVAVIHSSLSGLMLAPERLKWNLLAAIQRLVSEGLTVAVPSFTFSFCGGAPFDINRSPSETGMLGDWMRDLRGVVRTPHPIYSFAVKGPLSEGFLACPNSTTFSEDSIFAAFDAQDARIIMLGCGWEYCTQFHYTEEQAAVPYRYHKTFSGEADFGSGKVTADAVMFVRDDVADPVNDFASAVSQLHGTHALLSAPLGRSTVESVPAKTLGRICADLLSSNPYAFVKDAGLVRERIRLGAEQENAPPYKLAFLGRANMEALSRTTKRRTEDLLADRRVETFACPFGQLEQEILDEQSSLNEFAADVTVFADRTEDVLRVDSLDDPLDANEAAAAIDRYVKLIERYAGQQSGSIFVHSLAVAGASAFGTAAGSQPIARTALEQVNTRLREKVAGIPNLYLIDIPAIQAASSVPLHDPRLWSLGRFPYSAPFDQKLADKYGALTLSLLGRTARAIVVDLDNTLWGGVLGDDGISGLKIGGDYPGNAFHAFQKVLKRLRDRGIAIAVASKNNEENALAAIRSLPDMILGEDDLAAWRINWQPKSQNIAEIAQELDLGLDNILFIDDNPVERAEVRHALPRIKVLDLLEDPAVFADALLACPYIETTRLTAEDFKRSSSYKNRREMRATQADYTNIDDFLRSLDSHLHFWPLDDGNLDRCLQLVNKTNQFNATTRRYDASALQAIGPDDGSVIVVGLEDRFNGLENVGVMVLRWNTPEREWAEIDTFLLSCRVLGRGAEKAILGYLAERARAQGMHGLVGRIIDTERNGPVRHLYRDNGFESDGVDGLWRRSLKHVQPIPDWFAIEDHMSTERVLHVVG